MGIALCCQFFPLVLLTWYLVCWGSAPVTVGCASLPYLVWYIHCWKQLMSIPIFWELPRKTIFWFYLWGWIALCCQFFNLELLTWYFVFWGSTLMTFGRTSLPYLVWSRHCWKQLRCRMNIQILTKVNDLFIWSVWLATNNTWQLSPLKVIIIDPGISRIILDINVHPISFRTTPKIFQNSIAGVSRSGIYKSEIQAEILQNLQEGIYKPGL